jgi:hypothetical protein
MRARGPFIFCLPTKNSTMITKTDTLGPRFLCARPYSQQLPSGSSANQPVPQEKLVFLARVMGKMRGCAGQL